MRPFFIYFSLLTALFGVTFDVKAEVYPSCNPSALYHDADTTEWQEAPSSISASAPISVQFMANPQNNEGWTSYYEWRFTREGETEPFMIRYDENTDYDFTEAAAINVSLYYKFTKGEQDIEEGPTKLYTITAYESKLQFPNAFSPNGDGYNDVYKAKKGYRSIVDFHAYIFNRWGQKLYEWTNPAEGWDGTYNGKDVKEGVYYVLVKAKGADGQDFTIKRDVNLLRSYDESAEGTSTTN